MIKVLDLCSRGPLRPAPALRPGRKSARRFRMRSLKTGIEFDGVETQRASKGLIEWRTNRKFPWVYRITRAAARSSTAKSASKDMIWRFDEDEEIDRESHGRRHRHSARAMPRICTSRASRSLGLPNAARSVGVERPAQSEHVDPSAKCAQAYVINELRCAGCWRLFCNLPLAPDASSKVAAGNR